MKKICIFCGDVPEDKTKEHVIPKWLLEMTGDPERPALFGPRYDDNEFPFYKFSYDQFTFPACKSCNGKSSVLESKAKYVIASLLGGHALSAMDFNVLLTWMDKVRIGLWLGMMYLQKNSLGIRPKFYIDYRASLYDRIIIIYKYMTPHKRLNFSGCDVPAFQYMPSCFSLFINNYCLFNASSLNLCSPRLGFPFTSNHRPQTEPPHKMLASIEPGFHRLKYPIMRKTFLSGGTILAQPLFREHLQFPSANALYESEYVRQNSLDYNEGIGCVFYEKEGQTIKYPDQSCMDWMPKHEYSMKTIFQSINKQTYQYQLELMLAMHPNARKNEDYKFSRKVSLRWSQFVQDQLSKYFDG